MKLDAESEDHCPERRTFLTATAGAGGCAVGAGLYGLGAALAPSMDVQSRERWFPLVDMSALEPGVPVGIPFEQRLNYVQRLSVDQERRTGPSDISDLVDPKARNANLPSVAEASPANRSVQHKGSVVVFDGICGPFSHAVVPYRYDGAEWFCPYSTARYDALGRVLRNGWENLLIPRYRVEGQSGLRLLPGRAGPSRSDLDWLLHRTAPGKDG